MTPRADRAEIGRALALLHEPDAVVELRVPHTKRGTVSGYYTDAGKLAADAARLSGTAPGTYLTLNSVKPKLLGRARNRAVEHAKTATGDGDVTARRWLLVDFDPVRPSGTSSTDAEHEAALTRARECRTHLREELDFPTGALVLADSGNGAHVLVRVDLPNDDACRQLVERCLHALAFRFDDAHVTVDRSVGNAGRIVKLYGTLAAKGDATPERPHRLARILKAPVHGVRVASRALLERLAALVPAPEQRNGGRGTAGNGIDVEKWLAEHRLAVQRSGPWQGGTRWLLKACPFNAEHRDGSAAIFQFPSGAVAFRCLHNGCAGKDWRALRECVEPRQLDYQAGADGLVLVKPRALPLPLTNFPAKIVAQVRADDGSGEDRRSFEIDAHLHGRVHRFSIPAAHIGALN